MKKILSLLFFAATIIGLHAQVANFSMSPDTAIVNGPATLDDILQMEIHIKNTDAVDRTFVWDRSTINAPFGWTSTVCDPIACRPSSTTTAEFELKANESYTMLLDVSTDGAPGIGYYRLKLYEKGKPNQYFIGKYRFNATLVNTREELEANKISLFPNPSRDFFTLKGNAELSEIQLLNLSGMVIRTYPYTQSEIYPIEDLQSGVYMVNLIGKNHTRLATKKLVKS